MRDDHIYRQTRIIAVFITLILLAGFILLYFFPADTQRLFAWTITPRMTPLLMGAGYASGAYFFARTVFARRWHWVGLGILPITPFAFAMGLATLLHWDRFNHGHISFWLWAIVYAITPFLVPYIWFRNQATDPRRPDPDDAVVPWFVRGLVGLAGVPQLLLALGLFLAPSLLIPVWPWQLTPLTSRVVGGWWSLLGAGALLLAAEPRWSAWRITIQGTLIFDILMLVAFARAWGDLNPANPLTWGYLLLMFTSLSGLTVLYAAMEFQRWRRTRMTPLPAAAAP